MYISIYFLLHAYLFTYSEYQSRFNVCDFGFFLGLFNVGPLYSSMSPGTMWFFWQGIPRCHSNAYDFRRCWRCSNIKNINWHVKTRFLKNGRFQNSVFVEIIDSSLLQGEQPSWLFLDDTGGPISFPSKRSSGPLADVKPSTWRQMDMSGPNLAFWCFLIFR